MPNFNRDKYYNEKNYEKGINWAREDLEKDYPGSRVFIWYNNTMSPGYRPTEISLAPPDNEENVVRGDFRIYNTSIFSPKDYGYNCVVFSEGQLEYNGKLGSDTSAYTGGYTQSKGASGQLLTWRRHDGSTRFRTTLSVDPQNWMKNLDDDLYLSSVTIPGTHDSHALVGTPIVPFAAITELVAKAKSAAECQDISIKTQLEMGIRSFDLRYGADRKMRHGQVELPGTIDEVLHIMTDFLDAHPSETILVSAKWDVWSFISNKGTPEDEPTRQSVDDLFRNLPRFYHGTSTPRLRDCRGKLVLLKQGGRHIGIDTPGTSEHNPSQPIYPEWDPIPGEDLDMAFRLYKLKHSWADSEHTLKWVKSRRSPARNDQPIWDTVGLNDFHMDGDSVAGGYTILPRQFADWKNDELLKWLKKECAMAKVHQLGTVVLDFAGNRGQELITRLILTNFT